MINRASVPVCGNARKSAGPAKWPGKKKYCQSDTKNYSLSIRFYLHKEFRAAEIRFSLHKEFRAAEIRFYLHKRFRGLFEIFEWENGVYTKTFPAARANWLRNPIRKMAYIFKNISRFAGYMVKKSFVNKFKNEGDVMITSGDFQTKNLSSVGRILGTQT